jgi:sporulation protein YabP
MEEKMEKIKEISTNLSHSFSVSERKNIIISGVVKIDSFDNEEFLIETVQGYMNIKGENLEVVKLDTYQGNITIKGKINSINYIDETSKKDSSVFSRLFK